MSKNSSDVVITSALRTPIGRYKGSLKNLSASKLGSIAIKEVIYKSKLDLEEIDEVIMGHVLTSGLGQNPARQASIGAGVPVSKPAHIVNQVCGSGLRSVVSGYQSISLGENKIVIAGGQENMSRATHAIYYREDKKFSENKLVDTMIKDGLLDSFNDYHMGVTAENVAEKYKISRDEQDNFSLNSQKKTEKAYSQNRFKDELIKLQIEDGDKKFIFEKDEHPRPDTTLEALSKLPTPFRKEGGSVTPGNASGVNDGAAAMIIASEDAAKQNGLKIRARIVACATAGVEPRIMGIGPAPASQKVLDRAGLKISDMDVIELNEAFASQALATMRELGVEDDDPRVNPNGGAIALGHPLGASGARLILTAAQELEETGGRYGLCTMCIGVGQGMATIIERV